jgi:hypothetical protein
MAQGDVVFFDQALVDAWSAKHNLASDTIKVGLISSAVTPAATTSDPRWGAGGSTNLSTNELSAGGNYTAGGATIVSTSIVLSAGVAKFDGNDISWAASGSNPSTSARWGIIYNSTDAGKRCLGYVDLGSDFDMRTGQLDIVWNASGISTTDQV